MRKACDIFKSKLGPSHRTVGDCLYSIALLYKHQFKLAKAIVIFKEALATYQVGVGPKNLKCAHTLKEMGKVCIL